MPRGFSWKRATGISSAKSKISRKTGIPLSKSGRKQKMRRVATGGGCCIALLSLVGYIILAVGAGKVIAALLR